jgi:hypothetical protein
VGSFKGKRVTLERANAKRKERERRRGRGGKGGNKGNTGERRGREAQADGWRQRCGEDWGDGQGERERDPTATPSGRAAHRPRSEVARQSGGSDDKGGPSYARSGAGDRDTQPSRIHHSSRSPRSPVQSSIRPSLDFFLFALARRRARLHYTLILADIPLRFNLPPPRRYGASRGIIECSAQCTPDARRWSHT